MCIRDRSAIATALNVSNDNVIDLPISLDTLINPDVSPEDDGANQMKMLYCSCPSEMRETLLHHTQETAKELTELSEKFETN